MGLAKPLFLLFLVLVSLVAPSAAQVQLSLLVSLQPWDGDCSLCQDGPCSLPSGDFTLNTLSSGGSCNITIVSGAEWPVSTIDGFSVTQGLYILFNTSVQFTNVAFRLKSPVFLSSTPSLRPEISGSVTFHYYPAEPNISPSWYSSPTVSISGLNVNATLLAAGNPPLDKRDIGARSTRQQSVPQTSSSSRSSSGSFSAATAPPRPYGQFELWFSVSECNIRSLTSFQFQDLYGASGYTITSTSVYVLNSRFLTGSSAHPYLLLSTPDAPVILDITNSSGSISSTASVISTATTASVYASIVNSTLTISSGSFVSASSPFVTLDISAQSTLTAATIGLPFVTGAGPSFSGTVLVYGQSSFAGFDVSSSFIRVSDSALTNIKYASKPSTSSNSSPAFVLTGESVLFEWGTTLMPTTTDANTPLFSPTDVSITISPVTKLLMKSTENLIQLFGTTSFLNTPDAAHNNSLCQVDVNARLIFSGSSSSPQLTTACHLNFLSTGPPQGQPIVSGVTTQGEGIPSLSPRLGFSSGVNDASYDMDVLLGEFSVVMVLLTDPLELLTKPTPTIGFGLQHQTTGFPKEGFAVVYPPEAPFLIPPQDWLLFLITPDNSTIYGNSSAASVPQASLDMEIEVVYSNDFKKSAHMTWAGVYGRLLVTPSTNTQPSASSVPLDPSSSPHSATPVTPISIAPHAPTVPSPAPQAHSSTSACSGNAPSSAFTCVNGTWTAPGSVTSFDPIIIPSTTVIEGNFSAPSITFSTIGSSLIIQGCLNLTQGTITADLSQGIGSHPSGSITIEQNSECPNSLLGIGVNVKQPKTGCKKVKSKIDSASTKQTLVVLFTTDSSSCNTKWIVLGAVLGVIVILGAVAAAVFYVIIKKKREEASFKAIQG